MEKAKLLILAVVICFSVSVGSVLAETLEERNKLSVSEAAFASNENFNKWITYYYIQPEPEKIPSAIKYYADSELFNKANSRFLMVAFFAALFRKNDELMKKAYEDISINGSINSRIILLRTFWLVNSSGSNNLINKANLDWKSAGISKEIQSILNTRPPDIFNDDIISPTQLDMLWVTFMATGDSTPIKRIISTLHLLKDGKDLEVVIGGAARWSLGSNAMQHRRVYEICQEELKTADGETRNILQEIISKQTGSDPIKEAPAPK